MVLNLELSVWNFIVIIIIYNYYVLRILYKMSQSYAMLAVFTNIFQIKWLQIHNYAFS